MDFPKQDPQNTTVGQPTDQNVGNMPTQPVMPVDQPAQLAQPAWTPPVAPATEPVAPALESPVVPAMPQPEPMAPAGMPTPNDETPEQPVV